MTVAATQLPLFGQYPAGVSIKSGIDALLTSGTLNSTTAPVDVVDVRSRMTTTFTAAAGDNFSVGKLFSGVAPGGSSIAGYKVGLRADGANGTLTLDGQDVSTKGSFSADEFSRLQYTAGPFGSSDDLVVVAQTGTRLADGTLSNEVDSPAVQLTANVTGARSINTAGALLTNLTGADRDFIATARQATIFTGFGAARPSLTTVGNLTATAGDNFALGKLFSSAPPSGSSIAGYKVALRADGANGTLTLDGQDVSTKGSFTADEFSRLQFAAGPSGSSDDLVVVAQTGTRLADGTLFNEVDSPAVQITANVTGTRSINAAGALLTDLTGADGNFISTARQASIFTGFGAARPSLTTVGNLTATAGDNFSLGKLFGGTAPSGSSIAGYKVALRADGANGTLTLDGQDVSTKGSFTADEFSRLQYTAGPSGSSDDLVVVAQSGTRLPDGTLSNEVDSPAVQITASATGARSINAAGALLTDVTGADGSFMSTARQASIFTGFGAARPTLTTVGNLTATAGDAFSLAKLFSSDSTIAGYKVALRADGANGTLTLDGQDVSTKGSFTADEFSRLQFTAGPQGSSDDLVVVAQSGTRLADGTLSNEVDSPAVQITTHVTGARSINAAGALLTDFTGADGNFMSTARQASIFTGFGAARPSLTTVGNLTATAGDNFALAKLFGGTAPSGISIASYKVALRADGANGTLTLDGQDVSTKSSFTADEFSRLQYTAGPSGSSDDLVVVAQSGTRLADGTLFNEVDSPAVQITASVTGARSINAAGALQTTLSGGDSDFVTIARQASIFTGFGAARPGLSTVGLFGETDANLQSAADLLGAFQSSEQVAAGSPELADGILDTIGQSISSTSSSPTAAQQALDWVLAANELGGFQATGASTALQRLATAAYRTSASL